MAPPVEIELETRRRIYEFVVANPGSHLRAIKEELDMPMGQLEYHLHYLEQRGLLDAKEDRYYKRFFPSEMSATDRRVLSAIRQEKPRQIVLLVLQSPGVDHRSIQEALGIGASSLSFYMKDLIEKEVIEKRRKGRRSLYSVADVERVVKLLITYRPSFLDKMVDRFLETWLEVQV
jgi:predicted transcriptional regulator